MSNPVFIHVMTSGDVFFSADPHFVPTGTMLACYRVNSNAASQKLGTVTGNAGSYAASGSTGKHGKEVV